MAVLVVLNAPRVHAQCVSAWENLGTNTPGARQQATLVYDSARGRVILFGGFDSLERKGDTWAFDGATWSRLTQVGPSARAGHAMVYDSVRGKVVMFGGVSSTARNSQTWEFGP